jgi:putative phage-type endonuclease
MIISEREQGTIEWKEERYGHIGGTSLADLMVKKPIEESALFDTLIAAHTEPFIDEETFINKAMERGTELEPEARSEASKYFDLEFLEFGTCKREGYPMSHCSPDGFTSDFKDGLEVKCPSASTHIKYCRSGEIPKEYIWQVVNYFFINSDLERLHFVSYRPENTIKPLFVKTVTRESLTDMGTKAKPKMETIQYLVEEAEIKSLTISAMVGKEIEKLRF